MQKPFAFYLSALTLLLSISACWPNPNTQTGGQDYLQGEWQQDSVPAQKQLVCYALHHFRFSCDSFFMTINYYSKVNYGADSCMKSGHWVQYTRGHYEQRNDTIFLKGQYCNPDFTIRETPACTGMGVYAEIFKVAKKAGANIQLSSTSSVISINARLVKKTSCSIKPL
jgi:hypothetical protein